MLHHAISWTNPTTQQLSNQQNSTTHMHNIKSLASVLFLSAVLASCTDRQNEPAYTASDGKTEMRFTLSHPSQTRATDTAFEQGDAVGLYVAEASAPLEIAGNAVNNERLVFSGSDWTPDRKLFWDNGTYNVFAYYPRMAQVTSVTDLPVRISDDQTAGGYEASDILYASALGVAASADPVSLTFRQIMSKLTVRLAPHPDSTPQRTGQLFGHHRAAASRQPRAPHRGSGQRSFVPLRKQVPVQARYAPYRKPGDGQEPGADKDRNRRRTDRLELTTT